MARYTSKYFQNWVDKINETNATSIDISVKEAERWIEAVNHCENIHIQDNSLLFDSVVTPLEECAHISNTLTLKKCLVCMHYNLDEVTHYFDWIIGLEETDSNTFKLHKLEI